MKRTTSIGRIVQGNPLVGNQQFDDRTNQPKLNKQGEPVYNWYMNVAFSKQDPDTHALITEIAMEAARAFPQLFPQGANLQAVNFGCVRPDFAFKIVDGDTLDLNGQPHAKKDGFANSWIVKVSTYAGAMRVVNGLQNNAPITEVGSGPNHIKTGDFVRVGLDFKTNGWAGEANSKPGIYMNPDIVQLVGYGEAIVGGPDANEVFKQQAAYVPQGMSTTPTAGTAALPGTPQPMAAPGSAGTLPVIPQQQAPQALPVVPQQQAPAPLGALPTLPNHAAVQQVLQQPVYQLTPAAAQLGKTKEQLNAEGYTDEVLLANGYLVKVN